MAKPAICVGFAKKTYPGDGWSSWRPSQQLAPLQTWTEIMKQTINSGLALLCILVLTALPAPVMAQEHSPFPFLYPVNLQDKASADIEDTAPQDTPGKTDKQNDTRSLKEYLLSRIGDDLQSLDPEFAIEELNYLAKYALTIERPDIFRTVMVSEVDEHWADLSDARTALNMIAWLPDTADNLSPRIKAARLAISNDELPDLEAQRLWRDLRARVERVGDPELLRELASAMIQSSSTDLLIETVNRFYPTDHKRIETFSWLLETYGPVADPSVAEDLYDTIVDLGGLEANTRRPSLSVVKALWTIGKTDEALELLDAEPDPMSRLHIRFEMLAHDAGDDFPDAGSEGAPQSGQ